MTPESSPELPPEISAEEPAKKIAVILFNLGGPDGPESIRPFLFNFFMDRNIIRLPLPFRFALASLISIRRTKREAGTSYGFLKGRSPLLDNTRAQARALEARLNEGSGGSGENGGEERGEKAVYRVYVAMRYWHPMARETVRQVKADGADEIVLLPLYPQYSTTTTRSSLQTWKTAAAAAGLVAPVSLVCCYPEESGFIGASARNIRAAYDAALMETAGQGLPPPRVLFSAHGLPKNVIADGDPYQFQCEESAKAIVRALDIPGLDWRICYQSRVGKLEWIGPATDSEIVRAGRDNVPLVVYPHAFVSEHVETLVEIEIEYRHLAREKNVPYFARVPTVGTDPAFIGGLAALVRSRNAESGISGACGARQCPATFNRCCMQDCALG